METTQELSDGPVQQGTLLGVISLGCALLSVAACVVVSAVVLVGGRTGAAVVIFGLPVLGVMAMVTGGMALVQRRARGVPLVRGPAAMGVIIGLASAVLQGSVAVGALMAYVPVKKMVTPVVTAVFEQVEAGRADVAVEAIPESSRTVIDAARVERFVGAVTDVVGTPARAVVGLDMFVRTRRVFADAAARGAATGPVPDLGLQVKTVEVEGPRGRVMVFLVLDDAALQRDDVRIADAMAVLPGERCVVLLPEGRMKQLAGFLGLEEVKSEE